MDQLRLAWERPTGLRLALITTPRVGNNWLRHLLHAALELPTFPIHTPAEFDWKSAPRACVVALHWRPTTELRRLLADHGFRIVTILRHPLDTLISILQFTLHDLSTSRWLDGEGGNEDSILGVMPRSQAFADYAASKRAQALLSISRDWAQVPDCLVLHYEALVSDTPGVFADLLTQLGTTAQRPIDAIVRDHSLANLRRQTGHEHHFWQGTPNLWKRLLTSDDVCRLATVVAPFLAATALDADVRLSPSQADAHWVELCGSRLGQELRQLHETRQQLTAARLECDRLRSEVASLQIGRENPIQSTHSHAPSWLGSNAKALFHALGLRTVEKNNEESQSGRDGR